MSIRLILVLLLLASTGAQGGDTEGERATLRGLDGVQVVVEDLQPDVERNGLTRQQLQTDVELRLRKAGIRVLTEQELDRAPGQTPPRPSLRPRALKLTFSEKGLPHLVTILKLVGVGDGLESTK
jgi:hypothetical protein